AASGSMASKIGRSSESYDGIGCGSKRVSGMAQRSISRSNTDSDPKKNTTNNTKPSTRPNHVCTQVIAKRKDLNTEASFSARRQHAREQPRDRRQQRSAARQKPPDAEQAPPDERPTEAHQHHQKREEVCQREGLFVGQAGGHAEHDAERDEPPGEGVAAEQAGGDTRQDGCGRHQNSAVVLK